MDRLEKIYRLYRVLKGRRTPIGPAALMEALDCSKATVYRVIEDLRDQLGAPIEQVRGQGWSLDPGQGYELPGLWFNASEIHALLAFHTLLHGVQPGLLDDEIEPLRDRIEKILAGRAAGSRELERRVRILGIAARDAGPGFQTCATALVERKRLLITHYSRPRNEITERRVSPQRLVRYRDNWYLDAWCHKADGLRTFSLDCIRSAKILDRKAREIPDKRLDRELGAGYGIFAGKAKHTAVLRFTPERARWVVDERWHPKQKGRFLPDGRYELHIPYSDARELEMDILKFGAEVEVVSPQPLRQAIADKLRAAVQQYA